MSTCNRLDLPPVNLYRLCPKISPAGGHWCGFLSQDFWGPYFQAILFSDMVTHQVAPMIGESRQLVTYEPVKFEK